MQNRSKSTIIELTRAFTRDSGGSYIPIYNIIRYRICAHRKSDAGKNIHYNPARNCRTETKKTVI